MSKQNRTEIMRLRITPQERDTWISARHNKKNTSELIRKAVNYYIYRVAEG